MARTITIPWTKVTNAAGREGRFKVEGGMITVEYQGKTKTTRSSSSGLPPSMIDGADASLAAMMLHEFP